MGPAELPRSRVLVVDDEALNRILVRAVLEAQHDVVEAGDGDEALRVLASEPVDLVLLDVMMPARDGFEICREIKARYQEPYLPVLLLTALGDQQHRVRGLEAGADDFLSKPFERRELELRVRAFLRLRHQDDLIRNQLAELQRLDRLKDDLAALIVHDARNPLSGLDGFLRLARDHAKSEGQREMLDWALVAADNLRGTLEDMLKIRLMEESQLELELRRISLHKLARRAADSVRGNAEIRHVAIEVGGEDLEVEADEKLLRRAVENLLVNGLRYTRTGTNVLVEVGRKDGAAVIDVADRGPGIAEPLKQTLFQKYGSVEAAVGQARRGNGLGLYLVRLTAEAHRGAVVALDRPGGGAIFRIQLPLAS